MRLTRTIATICVSLFACNLSYAKTLTLYADPKADAKAVGTLDSTEGMVPIYTPKEGTWMKVGDPKNGNVGWIKISDLSDNGSLSTEMTVTQQTVNTGNGPKTYQVVKFATPTQLSPEQSQALAKQIQLRQAEMEKNMQRMMRDFYLNMKDFYQINPALFNNSFPVIVPVVVTPASIPAPAPTPAKK